MRLIRREGLTKFSPSDDLSTICAGLANDCVAFIETSQNAIFVPLEKIVLSRVRPDGVEKAVLHMKRAQEGGPKRSPVLVKPLDEDLFLVVDGNSTCAVLAAAGCEFVVAETYSK